MSSGSQRKTSRPRYSQREARQFIRRHRRLPHDLALRIYSSRLLGAQQDLVLHGGGNTSVKLPRRDLFGKLKPALLIKGSGVDLSTIDADGFAELDLAALERLRHLKILSDADLSHQLVSSAMHAGGPRPSVEALLHAFLPARFVDHTHADAVLALANQREGKSLVAAAYGDRIAFLPYAAAGLPLAKAVLRTQQRVPSIEGVIVRHHGIFTFAEDAQTAYTRMIHCVRLAEAALPKRAYSVPRLASTARADDEVGVGGVALVSRNVRASEKKLAQLLPILRGLCAVAGPNGKRRSFVAEPRISDELIGISREPFARAICRAGVITPDHAIRTKDRVLWCDDVSGEEQRVTRRLQKAVSEYRVYYNRYIAKHASKSGPAANQYDSAPRAVLIKGLGLVAFGNSRIDAGIAADISAHSLRVKRAAAKMTGYAKLHERHVYDMEFWPLQRKKLVSQPFQHSLLGKIALVTGGAGAIGLSIAEGLLRAGATVVISDIDRKGLARAQAILSGVSAAGQLEAAVCDVTDEGSVETLYHQITRALGGIDIVVPNAGIAHVAKIADLKTSELRKVNEVNFTGCFNVIRHAVPVLRRQRLGGNVVIISSKNVFAPGAAFGAYSATKAASHQLGKVAALELAEIGARVNMVNPDGVFGHGSVSSKLWDVVGPERMKARGLDPGGLREYYRQRNLLKVSVSANDVANAVLFFATEQTPTTGASLPVDGGVPAAFPR